LLSQFEQVVKASKGHIPQPFLISKAIKNWYKDKRDKFLFTKKISTDEKALFDILKILIFKTEIIDQDLLSG